MNFVRTAKGTYLNLAQVISIRPITGLLPPRIGRSARQFTSPATSRSISRSSRTISPSRLADSFPPGPMLALLTCSATAEWSEMWKSPGRRSSPGGFRRMAASGRCRSPLISLWWIETISLWCIETISLCRIKPSAGF
jgi:hypothetical protein